VGVEGLDEGLVELVPQQTDLLAVLGVLVLQLLGDEGAAEVQIDQAGAAPLGGAAGEGGGEGALVVVVAALGGVVLAAAVDDGVAGLQQGRVAGADQAGVAVGGQLAQHVDGQGLVGVEVAIVGADLQARRAFGLETLRCRFGHFEGAAEHKLSNSVVVLAAVFSLSLLNEDGD